MPPDDSASPLDFLPPATTRIGRRRELSVAVVRSLDSGDVDMLASANAPPQSGDQRLKRIRASHHRLAELIAGGEHETTAGLLTGYTPAYISTLKNDPSFQELLAYYSTQKQVAFADLLVQTSTLSSDIVAEIQERLSQEPEAFSLGELRAQLETLTKTTVGLKGVEQGRGPGGNAPPSTLRVEFVSAPQRGPSIEGTSIHVEQGTSGVTAIELAR